MPPVCWGAPRKASDPGQNMTARANFIENMSIYLLLGVLGRRPDTPHLPGIHFYNAPDSDQMANFGSSRPKIFWRLGEEKKVFSEKNKFISGVVSVT
jgi:hypothetical protein